MRFYFAYFAHESSSFSPIPTGIGDFSTPRGGYPLEGCDNHQLDPDNLSEDFALLSHARARGHEVVVGPMAVASPSRPASRSAYEYIRDQIVTALTEALPVDAVLLFLHGAQLAEGYDDCEGDLLTQVRAVVGPDIPIGVELDLHCNLTPAMASAATVLMPCKEYPHSDFGQRADELIDIIEAATSGVTRPFMVLRRVPMLGMFHTTRQPMRGFVDRIKSLEGHGGVLSIGLGHGFPYADIEELGAAVLIVGEADRRACEALADDLASEWFALRQQIVPPSCTIEEGLKRALSLDGPVVIADTSDNPGGGAPGDSTHLLRALLEAKVGNVALGMIWDPPAVREAIKAGVGATLPLRLGGKIGPLSGQPLDLEVKVLAYSAAATQTIFGGLVPLGHAVAVETAGIQIVLNTVRQQVIDPACFTALGLDPWSKRLVVVKSAQHFYDLFAPHARHVIYIDAPGVVTNDYSQFDYQRLKRPLWPLDQAPFERFDRDWI